MKLPTLDAGIMSEYSEVLSTATYTYIWPHIRIDGHKYRAAYQGP